MNTTAITTFNNEEFGNVRTLTIDGEPWFVGKDIAECLGYTNTRDALWKHVEDEDKQQILKSQIATLENVPLPLLFSQRVISNCQKQQILGI